MKHESDGDTNCNWCAWYSHQRFGTGTGGLGNKGRVETIQTTALLKSARILRRVFQIWEDLLSLKFQWKPSANAGVKNSQKSKIIMIIIIIIIIIKIVNKKKKKKPAAESRTLTLQGKPERKQKKRDKYQDLSRELKRKYNMTVKLGRKFIIIIIIIIMSRRQQGFPWIFPSLEYIASARSSRLYPVFIYNSCW